MRWDELTDGRWDRYYFMMIIFIISISQLTMSSHLSHNLPSTISSHLPSHDRFNELAFVMEKQDYTLRFEYEKWDGWSWDRYWHNDDWLWDRYDSSHHLPSSLLLIDRDMLHSDEFITSSNHIISILYQVLRNDDEEMIGEIRK